MALSHLGFFLKLKTKTWDEEPSAKMYNKSMCLPTKIKLAHFTSCQEATRWVNSSGQAGSKVTPGHRANLGNSGLGQRKSWGKR